MKMYPWAKSSVISTAYQYWKPTNIPEGKCSGFIWNLRPGNGYPVIEKNEFEQTIFVL